MTLRRGKHSLQPHCCVFLIALAALFTQQQSRQSRLVWCNLEGCCNNRQNKKHKEEPGSCIKLPPSFRSTEVQPQQSAWPASLKESSSFCRQKNVPRTNWRKPKKVSSWPGFTVVFNCKLFRITLAYRKPTLFHLHTSQLCCSYSFFTLALVLCLDCSQVLNQTWTCRVCLKFCVHMCLCALLH